MSLPSQLPDSFEVYDSILKKNYDPLCIHLLFIVECICSFIPSRKDIQNSIRCELDIEIFKNMLKHNIYTPSDLEAIIDKLQSLFLQLCMPARDEMIKDACTKLKQKIQSAENHARFFVIFIDTIEAILVVMKDDMKTYLSSQRYNSDYNIFTTPEGQRWLAQRNKKKD